MEVLTFHRLVTDTKAVEGEGRAQVGRCVCLLGPPILPRCSEEVRQV